MKYLTALFLIFALPLCLTSCVLNKASKSEATIFIDRVDKDLRQLWPERDQAAWINQNFITDDTESLSAKAESNTAEYMTRAIKESVVFKNLSMPKDLARQLKLLRLAQVIPAPTNAHDRAELAGIQSSMVSMYGKGHNLDELSAIINTSRDYDKLLKAWLSWHSMAKPMRDKYERYVALGNLGAKEIGFANMGTLWRSGYDMTPEEFEADIERLWLQVKPLYDSLHCYVRAQLQNKYTKEKIPDNAPIPAHLLGNMWAQDWQNIYDLVMPYNDGSSIDLGKTLKARKFDAQQMVKLGEKFFTSLGFDALPETFWQRSLFNRPRDRDVLCHASAWDINWNNDLRIKMCIEPSEADFITIHHELGHIYYFHEYNKLPILFQNGANDGFHEGIGDTIALSITPKYLQKIGLIASVSDNKKALINEQMKMALDKVAFLPFGLLIDKWRWDVFSGKTKKSQYNKSWWDLRTKYQGISAPSMRSDDDFDPGAKFHVPGSTPYIRYFLARIYQFQFHKALCQAAGQNGPLHSCSIYGNVDAGNKLRQMLSLGAKKPWPEALALLSGETKADASALLEYFAPLASWLAEQNQTNSCGW